MTSLYVILDYENSQFAVNGNYITVPTTGDKKDRNLSEGSIVGIIVGVVIGVIILVGVIAFIMIRMKNRRLQENLAKYEQL